MCVLSRACACVSVRAKRITEPTCCPNRMARMWAWAVGPIFAAAVGDSKHFVAAVDSAAGAGGTGIPEWLGHLGAGAICELEDVDPLLISQQCKAKTHLEASEGTRKLQVMELELDSMDSECQPGSGERTGYSFANSAGRTVSELGMISCAAGYAPKSGGYCDASAMVCQHPKRACIDNAKVTTDRCVLPTAGIHGALVYVC